MNNEIVSFKSKEKDDRTDYTAIFLDGTEKEAGTKECDQKSSNISLINHLSKQELFRLIKFIERGANLSESGATAGFSEEQADAEDYISLYLLKHKDTDLEEYYNKILKAINGETEHKTDLETFEEIKGHEKPKGQRR